MSTAAMLAIGDELLAGKYPDRNSGEIAKALDRLGIETRRFAVLGDDRSDLAAAITELCAAHDVVVVSGGLGPTLDDVTREAAADAAGLDLERHEHVVDELRVWFEERGREMSAANERQALAPRGAALLPNQCGTAPGFRMELDGAVLFALPGPPREMSDMLERQVLPWLRARAEAEQAAGAGLAVAHHAFYLTGIGESDFSERVGPWMDRGAAPRMGVTSHTGVLSVSLRAEAATLEQARAATDERAEAFRERFCSLIYSETEPDLARAVGELLIERGVTLATAESCTGGLLAQRLTAVPGISAIYPGGWVTYANEVKERELGVPAETLERHGAVSAQVAAAMARGALRKSGAQLAVSLTGVAGPGGGTPQKPVGLVWCGLARSADLTGAPQGEPGTTRGVAQGTAQGKVLGAETVETFELRLPPVGRDAVRTFAVHAALDRIRLAVAVDRPGIG